MKKLILSILLVVSGLMAVSQTKIIRTTAANTVYDTRHGSLLNEILPVYPDTTTANLAANIGIDSCGAMIFTYADSGKIYVRKCFPTKYWSVIGGGGSSGGGTVTAANNGLQLNGATIQMGGSALAQYSAIGLNGFPLTINHNGVSKSAQADSNMLRFTNNTLAVASTDSLISPGIQFLTQGRKTLGGIASVPISFFLDAYGLQVNPSGNGIFRLRSRRNTTDSTIFSISATGIIQENLNVMNAMIGPLTTSNSNLRFGQSALSSITSGTLNLGIGLSSLAANTTGTANTGVGWGNLFSNTTGSNNTGIGKLSIGANITGSDNTAVGFQSLQANIAGINNTAIGSNALSLNDTTGNTAVGYNSMFSNTKGDLNTAVGGSSLFTNTIGYQNASFGYNSLHANTIGIKNTALGAAAMEESVSGDFNTATGMDVMLHNLTGDNNTVSGWLSWATSTAGSGNTVYGFNAGSTPTGGDNNIFIGNSSGTNGSQTLTPTNSIAIGTSSFTTASNQMVLGNSLLTQTIIFGTTHNNSAALTVAMIDTVTNRVYHIPAAQITTVVPTLQQVFAKESNTPSLTSNSSIELDINGSTGRNFNFNNAGNFGIGAYQNITTVSNYINVTAFDSITFNQDNGYYRFVTPVSGILDTTAKKPMGMDVDGRIYRMNSWAQVSGSSGTVSSVSFTGGLISVATATTTPALTVAGTSGGIPYFSSTSTWASSALLAANALMIGGGAGTAPSTTTTATGILTFLGTPSSANFLAAVTDETGTGLVVFATAPTFTTSITDPLVIGGTTASSTLTLRSTSGTGTTDAIIAGVGTAGATESWRVNTQGELLVGSATDKGTAKLQVTNTLSVYGDGAGTMLKLYYVDGSQQTGDIYRDNSTGGLTISGGISFLTLIGAGTGVDIYGASGAHLRLRPQGGAGVTVGPSASTPSALMHIQAGTTTLAPFKFTTGTSLTAAAAGAMEYTTPQLFFTNGGAQRQEIPQIQQTRVSTQYDNTTTTLGNVTGLTATLVAGKIYRFEAKLYTTSNVAGGIKVAIAGTCTATAIVYEGLTTDGGLTTQGRGTALAAAVGAVTSVTAAYVIITGTITVANAGTLTVQAAANAAVGTTSVLVGSTFVTTEML